MHNQSISSESSDHSENQISVYIELKRAKATIEFMKQELHAVKFSNSVLREENDRLSTLYQVRKSIELLD